MYMHDCCVYTLLYIRTIVSQLFCWRTTMSLLSTWAGNIFNFFGFFPLSVVSLGVDIVLFMHQFHALVDVSMP